MPLADSRKPLADFILFSPTVAREMAEMLHKKMLVQRDILKQYLSKSDTRQ